MSLPINKMSAQLSFLEISTWSTGILVLVLAFLLYKHFTRNFNYWKKQNVPYVTPFPFFGNFKDAVLFKTSVPDWHRQIYENSPDEPYVGIFFFDEPYLMIKSPELLKNIFIKDFDHFRDKNIYTPDHDPVQANLTFWQPNRLGWKAARSKISPFFSSGRIKSMFPIINKIGSNIKKYVNEKCYNMPTDGKELGTRYATDVITKCEFGIEANCLSLEDAEFRTVGIKMFQFTILNAIRQTSYFYFQSLARFFRMSFYGVKNMTFLCNVIQSSIDEREKSGIKGNDLVELLVQLRKDKVPEFEGEKVYSSAISIFIGGFETTGTTIAMLLHELCVNKRVQDKLRIQILERIKRNGFTYEALQSMKYLDLCIREVLRKYAPVPFIDRLCVKDYQIPGTDFIIEKGTPIYVPLLGFHYDERYFPEPEKFIPERFEDMAQINQNGLYYSPFGEGPRACLGERFALMSTKLAIVHILSEYEVNRTETTVDKIRFEKKSPLLIQAEGGISIKLTRLRK